VNRPRGQQATGKQANRQTGEQANALTGGTPRVRRICALDLADASQELPTWNAGKTKSAENCLGKNPAVKTAEAPPMIHTFRDLDVWRKGMDLVVRVYRSTDRFPKSETFGLTSQLRRAAVSIPSNIAEGKAIGGNGYPRHLKIAMGSEAELQTQLELARRLNFLDQGDADDLLEHAAEVGRMLAGLFKALPRQ
jgi:four helix bundle protein